MGHWRHIVVEGMCCSDEEPPPCGRRTVSSFCMLSGRCPYFGILGDSDERQAAYYVPTTLILKDKLRRFLDDWKWRFKYYLWLRWRPSHPLQPMRVSDQDETKESKAMFCDWLRKAKEEVSNEK